MGATMILRLDDFGCKMQKKNMLALKSDQIWQQIAHFNGPKDVRVGDRMEDGAK